MDSRELLRELRAHRKKLDRAITAIEKVYGISTRRRSVGKPSAAGRKVRPINSLSRERMIKTSTLITMPLRRVWRMVDPKSVSAPS
jgi:hypothetical protein